MWSCREFVQQIVQWSAIGGMIRIQRYQFDDSIDDSIHNSIRRFAAVVVGGDRTMPCHHINEGGGFIEEGGGRGEHHERGEGEMSFFHLHSFK